MTNSETKNFSQNVSSSYHLKDKGNNAPKLRFKGYNDEWKHLNFKSITTMIKDGTHGSYNDLSEGIPLLSAKDIDNGKVIIPDDCRRISLSDYNDIYKNYSLKINDILLTIVGTIGRVALVSDITNKYAFQRSVGILRANEYNNPQFILYLLQTDFIKKQFYSKVNQSAQGGIYLDTLGKIDFKIPTLPEQEKIASFLTLIDKKIEKQKELVELLKKYKRGLLSQIFSQKLRFKDKNWNNYPDWEEKTLNNIFDTVTDFVAAGSFADLRKNVQYNEKPDFAQLVRTIDLKNNFKNKDFVFISESAYNYLWRVNLNEDALILPNIGANIGEVYYICSFKLPYKNNVLGPNAILLKSSNNNLYYLYSRCLTDNFRKQLFLQVGASGQPKFNKTDLKKIKIKISINIDEQNKISEFLSKFDEKILQEERILDKLQNYKKGLLQQMFI